MERIEAMSDFAGGKLHIRRRLDGSVRMEFGREVIVVSPGNAIGLAQALLKEAGVEMVLAEPGQTVIRPKSFNRIALEKSSGY
jgi:hypothetical protein